ncbi:MAG: SH3 domain-containing protein [Lachnospiraceae bacterium]|nr:SH3 domain-containing protein [Lachnospiraceae bacterium]
MKKRLISIMMIIMITAAIISPVSTKAAEYATVSANLRVRSGPGLSYKQVGLIYKGTFIEIRGDVTIADGYSWIYVPDYGGYCAMEFMDGFITDGDGNEETPDITCETLENKIWRIGDVVTLSQVASAIKIHNYSDDYSISLVNTDIASVFDWYPEGFEYRYCARAVGIASITIKVTDNTGSKAPFEKTFKVTVYPNTMEEALEVICERLEGKFLTVNGCECAKGTKGHKSCSNCNQLSVVEKATWLHQLFPEITFSKSQFQQGGSGYTCWMGSQIIQYIAVELLNGGYAKLTYNRAPKSNSVFKFTKNDISKYAQVGDHLRLNDSHSVILLGINDDNTVKVIDVNSHQDGTNTRVAIYNRKLNGVKMKIYRTTVR